MTVKVIIQAETMRAIAAEVGKLERFREGRELDDGRWEIELEWSMTERLIAAFRDRSVDDSIMALCGVKEP